MCPSLPTHQIQRFRTLLEVRQHELRLSIQHQKQYARSADPEPEPVDEATSISAKELFLQRGKEEERLLEMVESALGRIREGSFGQCLSCGQEIDVKRLKAVPWTRYCIQCQEDMER
jgi:DnaK suppressor protein